VFFVHGLATQAGNHTNPLLAHDITQDLAAFSGAALAGHRTNLDGVAEVRGEFLVRGNSADAVEEQAPSSAPPRQIRITSVVDKLRSATADASINHRTAAMVSHIVVVWGS
jgi:hypothetical protein